ncbi:MAG: class I SAM-dependent methyltransferase [Burkholderiaceae bacterium]|nr:class I SAM-dependent methyltransferase [Burkholderiaceae bacterium]
MLKQLAKFVKSRSFYKKIQQQLNNQFERDTFITAQLAQLEKNSKILDAGCGSQRYRKYCDHLIYKSQDFGKYTIDEKQVLSNQGPDSLANYQYGQIDYVGDIWNIEAADQSFDVILCTEVFEHIPYPNETVKEFSRLLSKNGKLILTAPSNCLRHFDPYFFYSGFSDRWYEKVLTEHGLKIESISPVGDYNSWLAVELARTLSTHSIFAKILLLPAFLFYSTRKKTALSIDTLCMGYHVIASKR